MSGLHEMFNSFQATSSPTLKVVEAEKTLKNSPLKIVEGARYQRNSSLSKNKEVKGSPKGKKAPERISSSAQNLKQLAKDKQGD